MTALVLVATAVLIVIGLLCFWLGRIWERDSAGRGNPMETLRDRYGPLTINQIADLAMEQAAAERLGQVKPLSGPGCPG